MGSVPESAPDSGGWVVRATVAEPLGSDGSQSARVARLRGNYRSFRSSQTKAALLPSLEVLSGNDYPREPAKSCPASTEAILRALAVFGQELCCRCLVEATRRFVQVVESLRCRLAPDFASRPTRKRALQPDPFQLAYQMACHLVSGCSANPSNLPAGRN